MDSHDLSQLDRNTLRLWRATNLIGWGLVGLGAFVVTWVLVQALAEAIADAPSSALALLAIPIWIAGFLLPPLVAGIVIGDHVYRWPGWTAIVAGLFPAVVMGFRTKLNLAAAEWVILLLFPLVLSLITARVARARFEMRPRALRAT